MELSYESPFFCKVIKTKMIYLINNIHPIDNDFWSQIRLNIKQHLNTYGPKLFYTWHPIKFTMLVEKADYIEIEQKYILSSPNEYEIRNILSREQPELINNTIHHLYSIQKWLDKTNVKLEELNHIVEFGGGFGSTCRLIYELGFKGDYYIYDFPELIEIQKYYLRSKKIQPAVLHNKTMPYNEIPKLCNNIDLFIAQWSLSEANAEDREKVLNFLQSQHFLVAYSEFFGDNDNKEYFAKLTKQPVEAISHLPNHYYIFS